MRVVVFGAAGQVGRAVVDNLLAAGHAVRAFEVSESAWAAGEPTYGGRPAAAELVVGDLAVYADVAAAVESCDAIVHTAVAFPQSVRSVMRAQNAPSGPLDAPEAPTLSAEEVDRNESGATWLVNLKGLYNVLEAARVHAVRRVVHLGSCYSEHPRGVFFESDVRRPDGSLYAIQKRLQEEMCRQHHEAHGTRVLVLRPDYIVDGPLGVGRFLEPLPGRLNGEAGWVCRHDLAEAVALGLSRGRDFDVLHTVSTTARGKKTADEVCNAARTRSELGWSPAADLERYRPRGGAGIIDAHSHVWPAHPDDRYPLHPTCTPALLQPPSFTTDELLAVMRAAGVGRCVLIGHGVFHGFDNSYMLDAVKAHPEVFRVTAVIDEDADVVAQMRALLPLGCTSFRICPWCNGKEMVYQTRKPQWLLPAMWEEAARSGQVLCVLCDPADLPEVSAMCAAHPATRVVIDHCGRVGGGGTFPGEDVAALVALAAHENVHVKLSAFYALGKATPPYDDALPMLRRLREAFGCRRLLWASDNPYQVAGSPPTRRPDAEHDQAYRASLDVVRQLGLNGADEAAVVGGNAQALFFW